MGPEDLSAAVQAYYSQLDAYLNSQPVFIQNSECWVQCDGMRGTAASPRTRRNMAEKVVIGISFRTGIN